jgi:hypothetical protein
MWRGPLQREAEKREEASCGPPGIGAGIGGRPEPSSLIEQGPTTRRPSPMYHESIACYRESLPTQIASVETGERTGREAVIGRYPDVLVRNEPPAKRLLQGDTLHRRCRFFRLFGVGDVFRFGPITAVWTPQIRRRPAGRHAAERGFCNDKPFHRPGTAQVPATDRARVASAA